MKPLSDAINQLRLKTDFQRGVVFVLMSTIVLGLLLIAGRPQWAGPWFIASLFTFGVWRLRRQQSTG